MTGIVKKIHELIKEENFASLITENLDHNCQGL